MSYLYAIVKNSNRLVFQRAWYQNYKLQNYWVKLLFMRETAFLSPSWTGENCNKRMSRCHNTPQFQESIYYTPINDCSKLNNVYYSLATFAAEFPLFMKEETEAKEKYKQNIWKDFKSFDMVIDIDSPTHDHIEIAYQDMKKVHYHLARIKTSHYIRFSGNGFHIFLLPTMQPLDQESFNPENENNIYRQQALIAKDLYDRFSELIDIKIYDMRRVIKLPFSLVHYEKATYICSPLDRIAIEEWEHFRLDLFEIRNFLSGHPNFPELILKDYIFEYQ